MLHSGSRGVGNRIGTHFIELARARDGARTRCACPTRTSRTSREGSALFDDYVEAVDWAQEYARINRELMLAAVLAALARHAPPFQLEAPRDRLPPQLRRARAPLRRRTCS